MARAFGVLRRGGDLAVVDGEMESLLEVEPGFHPARILLAEVRYLEENLTAARELAEPVADELPGYLACQLLLGRIAERLDEPRLAYDAYAQIREASSVARERLEALRPRIVEMERDAIRELINQGRIEEAELRLAELAEISEPSRELLELERSLAVMRGDVEAEVEVLRQIVLFDPEEDNAMIRLAELEITLGDVRSGLDKLERLAEKHPDDESLAEKVERTKFLRRLELLPGYIREVAAGPVLDRAGFTTLLYWLVPEVRYAEVADPPIATDILDHPRREEILRVINLGLVPIDETLHRFSPEEPATRALALSALLLLLDQSEASPACLDAPAAAALDPSRKASRDLVCRTAARCGLLPEAADCLPEATLSGAEALDFFRLTLDILGSP